MTNTLAYLELAKQINRDRVDGAEARRRRQQTRPERRHWMPKMPPVPLRWRPARETVPAQLGCAV